MSCPWPEEECEDDDIAAAEPAFLYFLEGGAGGAMANRKSIDSKNDKNVDESSIKVFVCAHHLVFTLRNSVVIVVFILTEKGFVHAPPPKYGSFIFRFLMTQAPSLELPNQWTWEMALLSEDAYNFQKQTSSPQVQNLGYTKIMAPNRLCTVYQNDEMKTITIAFKGSSTEEDRSSDASIFYGREFRGTHPALITMTDPMFKWGEHTLQKVLDRLGSYELQMTGHSLGGSIAELLCMKYSALHSNLIFTSVFNPGMGQNEDYQMMSRRGIRTIHHLHRNVVYNDAASLIGNHGLGITRWYVPLANPKLDDHDIRQFTERKIHQQPIHYV